MYLTLTDRLSVSGTYVLYGLSTTYLRQLRKSHNHANININPLTVKFTESFPYFQCMLRETLPN
jgi:hypothetical protein